MDLLLHLVREQEVDISEVEISRVIAGTSSTCKRCATSTSKSPAISSSWRRR
jgi:hypothetical protein